MNQSELNKILDEAYAEISKNEFSEEKILDRVDKFADDINKMSIYEVAGFIASEDRIFTKFYIGEVLSKILCND